VWRPPLNSVFAAVSIVATAAPVAIQDGAVWYASSCRGSVAGVTMLSLQSCQAPIPAPFSHQQAWVADLLLPQPTAVGFMSSYLAAACPASPWVMPLGAPLGLRATCVSPEVTEVRTRARHGWCCPTLLYCWLLTSSLYCHVCHWTLGTVYFIDKQ